MKSDEFLPRIVQYYRREEPWSEWLFGAVLFADVSGFTPLSEALSRHGAEGAEMLTRILNRYFSTMISSISRFGGHIMKFGGDALLCFFPSDSSFRRSLLAARVMQADMRLFKKIRIPGATCRLRMKIGIACGDVLLAGVGNPGTRCDYVFAGVPVILVAEAEHHATAGDIVVAGLTDVTVVPGGEFEEISPGFHRLLDLKGDPGPWSDIPARPTDIRPYIIEEIQGMIEKKLDLYIGSLSEVVAVFMRFTGFSFTHEAFRLGDFHGFFTDIMTLTGRYHGALNRIAMGDKGDTFFLLFGAPRQTERKEELACAWALSVMETVGDHFPDVTLSIGMHVGSVFAGIVGGCHRYDYTIMGDSVNLAARIMQMTEPGRILVSGRMRELSPDRFVFADRGQASFKGKQQKHTLFELVGRQEGARVHDSRSHGTTQRFHGRREELAELISTMHLAFSGTPQFLLIEGETGIGKSFMVREFIRQHAATTRVLSGTGEISTHHIPYQPWRQCLLSAFFGGKQPGQDTIVDVISSFGPEYAGMKDFFAVMVGSTSCVGPRTTHEQGAARKLFHVLISRLFLRFAAEQPLIIHLENLHWFDSLSLQLLEVMLDIVEGHRLFVIATSRPAFNPERFFARQGFNRMQLEEIDTDTVVEMVSEKLEAEPDSELIRTIRDTARGNPFYVDQCLAHLLTKRMLVKVMGRWTLVRDQGQPDIGERGDLIAHNVHNLSSGERILLFHAACIGQRFPLWLLKRVSGRHFHTRVWASLKDREFLLEQSESMIVFAHAIIQDSIYRSVPATVRRQIHRRIASALESLADGEQVHITSMANHFYLGAVRHKAIRYCLLAGSHLEAAMSYADAIPYYQRAFELLKRGSDPQKWQAGLATGQMLLKAGSLSACEQFVRKLVIAATRGKKTEIALRSRLMLFRCFEKQNNYRYLNVARRLLASKKETPREIRAQLEYLVGVACYRRGNHHEARRHFRSMLSHGAEEIDASDYFFAKGLLAGLEKEIGDLATAMGIIDDAIEEAFQRNCHEQMYPLFVLRANFCAEAGNFAAARKTYEQVLEKSRLYGEVYMTGIALLNMGLLSYYENDHPAADALLEESMIIFERVGATGPRAVALNCRGSIAFNNGRYSDAYDCYRTAATSLERSHEKTELDIVYYNLAEVSIELGRFEEAGLMIEKGYAIALAIDNKGSRQAWEDLRNTLRERSAPS